MVGEVKKRSGFYYALIRKSKLRIISVDKQKFYEVVVSVLECRFGSEHLQQMYQIELEVKLKDHLRAYKNLVGKVAGLTHPNL